MKTALELEVEVARLRGLLQQIADADDADLELRGDRRVGVHCGVEDKGCTDRYEGADYGYTQGVERTLEWAQNIAREGISGEDDDRARKKPDGNGGWVYWYPGDAQ